jgi:hypothetical protein
MHLNQVELVLELYETRLRDILAASDDALSDAGVQRSHIEHALTIIPKMKGFIEEGKTEKMFRWLGFLQGVLYCNDIYTIDEMANHNR